MTRLEMTEFDSWAKFIEALETTKDNKEAFRSYEHDGETKKKKIISNRKLYFNNFALCIYENDKGKLYVSIDYFSADDRIAIAIKKKENPQTINV